MGRILAVDWGGRRLGFARSDALGLTAQPLPAVLLPAGTERDPMAAARHARDHAARAIVDVARREDIAHVVVGLPLELSGQAGESARRVEELVPMLRERLGPDVVVETWDERFTSALAERSLREEGRTTGGRRSGGGRERTRARASDKAVVDQRAALLLLQSWLDAHPGAGAPGSAS